MVLIGGLGLYYLLPAPPSFPLIAPGAYFGEMAGFDGKPDTKVPVYAEVIGKSNSLLVVPIVEGAIPELHPLVPSQRVKDAYEPPIFRLKVDAFSLTGEKNGEGYSGTLEPTGTWSLFPIDLKKLRESTPAIDTAAQLPKWLAVKAKSASVLGQLEELKSGFNQKKDHLQNLDQLLSNEKLLKERSQSRRDVLTSEISRVTEQKRQLAQNLRDALDDLSVLHRVRRDGQAVEVARRILKREQRWFDSLSTSDSGGDESLEEQLAANDKVDLQKLNSAAKKAEEIAELRRTMAEEQSQLQILETEYQRRTVKRVGAE